MSAHFAQELRRAWDRSPAPRRTARIPLPGDIAVLERTACFDVEWAILACHEGRVLAVAADGQPLVGSADLEIPATAQGGPLVLRCRHGGWVDSALFADSVLTASLARKDVECGHDLHSAAERGEVEGSSLTRDVENDLAYRDWINGTVEPAWRALGAISRPGEEGPGPEMRRQTSRGGPKVELDARDALEPTTKSNRRAARLLALVAAAILALAVGLIWHQGQTLEDLRAQSRLAAQGLERQHQRILEEKSAEHTRRETEARHRIDDLRREIEELGRELTTALGQAVVRSPATVPLEIPRHRRGPEEISISFAPHTSHLIFVMTLPTARVGTRYRFEWIESATGRLLVRKELRAELGELWLGLPTVGLTPGRYRLRILAPEEAEPIAEYDVRLRRE